MEEAIVSRVLPRIPYYLNAFGRFYRSYRYRNPKPFTLFKRHSREAVHGAVSAYSTYKSAKKGYDFLSSKTTDSMPNVGSRSRSRSRGRPRSRSNRRDLVRIVSRGTGPNNAVSTPASMRARSLDARMAGSRSRSRAPSRRGYRSRSRYTGSIVRYTGRNLRRLNRRHIRRATIGVKNTVEIGGSTTAQATRYVGHISYPSYQVAKNIIRAMLKRLFMKIGVNVDTFRDSSLLSGFQFAVGDQFGFTHKTTTTAPAANHAFTVAAGNTVLDLVNNWFDFVDNWQEDHFWTEMYYVPTATSLHAYVNIPLLLAQVEIKVKSTLKYQNVSVPSAADDEADEVDAVHLVGKVYQGRGTYTDFQGNSVNLIAQPGLLAGHPQFGYILANEGDFSTPIAQEPVPPYLLSKCKQTGSIHMDPGELKVSKLTFYKKGNLNWMRAVTSSTDPNTNATARRKGFGHFRIFALEKQIETSTVALATPINLNYELNLEFDVAVMTKRTTITPPFNEVGNVQND